MVAGISPNWRHISIVVFLILVIWYVFFNSNAAQPAISLKKPPQVLPSEKVAIARSNFEFIFRQVKKVQVEVYYEVWCPDSRRFILDQVLPVWRALKSEVDIHWKPFGKASVSGYMQNFSQISMWSISNSIFFSV